MNACRVDAVTSGCTHILSILGRFAFCWIALDALTRGREGFGRSRPVNLCSMPGVAVIATDTAGPNCYCMALSLIAAAIIIALVKDARGRRVGSLLAPAAAGEIDGAREAPR